MSRQAEDKSLGGSLGIGQRTSSAQSTATTAAAASSTTRPQARRGPSGAWNRLKPAVLDPLDAYGLPSKGETQLHDYKIQEKYYAKIVERYMKFCATSGAGEGLEVAFASLSVGSLSSSSASSSAPTTTTTTTASTERPRSGNATGRPNLQSRDSPTDCPNDMPTILQAMRKLREGVLGSRRKDVFAQRAYKFIIHASILARHWESYQPALLYLLHEIHPQTPLSIPELNEFVGYRILDLACRQYELLEAMMVRKEYQLQNRKINTVLSALVHDDWVWFWRTRHAVDGYQRAVMEFAVDKVRSHALKSIGRAYLRADKAFIEKATDETWDLLVKSGVGWQLEDSGNVVIRKTKTR